MIITVPDNLLVAKQSWGQRRAGMSSASVFGGAQALEFSQPRWTMAISPPKDLDLHAGRFKALVMRLRGMQNQLACHDMMRPTPLGTMRGTMTFAENVAAGATTIKVQAGGQSGKTLIEGDYLGFGSGEAQQVVFILEPAVADASGVIELNVESPLRTAFTAGDPVVWDKPKAIFRRDSSDSSWDYEGVLVSGMTLSLIEDWRV